jgi:hypothetical protein
MASPRETLPRINAWSSQIARSGACWMRVGS